MVSCLECLLTCFVQNMELTTEALEFLKGIFSLFDTDGVCTISFLINHFDFKYCFDTTVQFQMFYMV